MQREVDHGDSIAYNMLASALHSNRTCKGKVDERDFFRESDFVTNKIRHRVKKCYIHTMIFWH